MDQLKANFMDYGEFLKEPSYNTNLDSDPACWFTQLFSDGLPEDNVVNTLTYFWSDNQLNCTIANEFSGIVECTEFQP